MPFIRPLGGSVIGNTTAPSPDYFRRLDGVTWNEAYPYGTRTPPGSTISGDILRASPAFTGAMTLISDLAFNINSIGANPRNSRLAIYSNRAANDPFPDTKLWESGEIPAAATGFNVASPNLAVNANSLLWIVHNTATGGSVNYDINDTTNTVQAVPFGYRQAASWVGFGNEFSVNFAQAYATAFPATFPTTAGGATIVGIGSGAIAFRIFWRGT
jgi:hypothetical protein